MSYAKPLPVLDSETQPFWEGCRQGKLRLQRCTVRSRPFSAHPFLRQMPIGRARMDR